MTTETPVVTTARDVLLDLLFRVRLVGAAATLAPDPGALRVLIADVEPVARAAGRVLETGAPEALLALHRAFAAARAGRFDDSHTELLAAHGYLAAALR